jgi:hypothetical protein
MTEHLGLLLLLGSLCTANRCCAIKLLVFDNVGRRSGGRRNGAPFLLFVRAGQHRHAIAHFNQAGRGVGALTAVGIILAIAMLIAPGAIALSDLFSALWVAPLAGSRLVDAFRLYLDYDGAQNALLGESVRAVSSRRERWPSVLTRRLSQAKRPRSSVSVP